jgi:acetyl-CoA C-acetyltransferase
MGMCAVNAHKNAILNPDAQLPKEFALEKVLEAEPVADPLSLYDCSLVTDGAAFVVLADEDTAKSLSRHRLVEVAGSGHAGDSLRLDAKSCITSFAASKLAAKEAYNQSSLQPQDINFAEVHDCFTITELILYEDLQFSARGEGWKDLLAGKFSIGGEVPVNIDGGLKSFGHPIGASGLRMLYEPWLQFHGKAGKRQLDNPRRALTHNLGGQPYECLTAMTIVGID